MKLEWNTPGRRVFESGVDRGVLYVPGQAGVAWPGIKAVKEAPSGGGPSAYYLDGHKYANIAASEEFNATLEALSSPPEFAVCDGTVELAAGLFATQQPRRPFHFSYRTMIGNDLEGIDAGYKIHLVYFAIATPADRDNNTQSDQFDPLGLSWTLSTRPPLAFGYKPTAHFIIDSRTTAPGLLKFLEDSLYGSDSMTSGMIEQADLISLFTEPGPYITTNLTTNPSFETASDILALSTNEATNPSTEVNSSNWTNQWFGPGGAGTIERVPGEGVNGEWGWVKTWSSAPAGGEDCGFVYTHPVVAGQRYSFGMHIKTNLERKMWLQIQWFNASNVQIGSTDFDSVEVLLAEEQHRLKLENRTAPAGAVSVKINAYTLNNAQYNTPNFSFGDYLIGSGVTVSREKRLRRYFSGNTPIDNDFDYRWVGTPTLSASEMFYTKVAAYSSGNSGTNFADLVQSKEWQKSGTYSLRIVAHEGSDSCVYIGGLEVFPAGRYFTVLATARLEAPQTGELNALARTVMMANDVGGWQNPIFDQAPNEAGEHVLSISFAVPPSATWVQTRLYNGGQIEDGDVWWDDLMVVEIPDLQHPYSGPAFNGDTPNTLEYQYAWLGEPHKSPSIASSWNE